MTATSRSPCSGIFADARIEKELQARDESFCRLEQIKTLVMTWNAGASTPHSLRYSEQDKTFFPSLLKESGVPDILLFGFQELVDLEDKKTTASESFDDFSTIFCLGSNYFQKASFPSLKERTRQSKSI